MNVIPGVRSGTSVLDNLVVFIANSKHDERARVSPAFALHIMDKPVSQMSVLQVLRDLRAGEGTPEARLMRSDPRTRLDSHIVLSSLFLTTKPVSRLNYDCHDYVYYKENPPRNQVAHTGHSIFENPSGITVLDAMRSLTDWRDVNELEEGELVDYAGLDWDVGEFVELPDGGTMGVEVRLTSEKGHAYSGLKKCCCLTMLGCRCLRQTGLRS